MATARKLPSGSWRVRIFWYTDQEGKDHYKSFTAKSKKEAERAALQWKQNDEPEDITVLEAAKKYIKAKEGVLSPSTIKAYDAYLGNFTRIGSVKLSDLTSIKVQVWVSDLSGDLKPKTVRNIYGFFTAVLSMFAPDLKLKVSLPERQRNEYLLPEDEDILKLIRHTEGTRLWIALMLGRFYGLRRGEICALSSEDLNGNVITIRKSKVQDRNKNWIIKTPKTSTSYRSLIITEPLLSALKEIDGDFIDCNPDALLNRFRRAQKAAKVRPFNFHLLRHAFASSAAVMGIPDFYIASLGGWRPDSSVLKNVYQNVSQAERSRMMEKLNCMTQNMTRPQEKVEGAP